MARQMLALGVIGTTELSSGTGSVGLGAVVSEVGLLVAVGYRGGAGRARNVVIGTDGLPV